MKGIANAPAETEIEITPEMIEAGAAELLADYYIDGLGLGSGYAELVTRRVLSAALRTRRGENPEDL